MENHQKIARELEGNGLQAMLLTSEVSRFYATGFRSSAGVVLITKEKTVLITDFRYIEAARAAAAGFEVMETSGRDGYMRLLSELLSDCRAKVLGFEDACMTVCEHERYSKGLKTKLKGAGKMLSSLRSSKEEREISCLREVQAITEKALSEVLPLIRPGMSELELSAELVYRLLRLGAERLSFEPIVVSGENTSRPHGAPSERKLRNGDFITMDFGCVKNGYCSDMTRTVALGEADSEMRMVYSVVLEAQRRGIEAARAGTPGSEPDRAAREFISERGYGGCFGHGFGHGIGVEVHEEPSLSPSNHEPLPEGAVVSAEPGIYIPGKFGVRIEDMLVLRRDGAENLTKAEKKLIVI